MVNEGYFGEGDGKSGGYKWESIEKTKNSNIHRVSLPSTSIPKLFGPHVAFLSAFLSTLKLNN